MLLNFFEDLIFATRTIRCHTISHVVFVGQDRRQKRWKFGHIANSHFAVAQWLLQEYSDDAVSNGSEGEQQDGYPDSDDYQDEDQDNYSDDDFDEAAGAQDRTDGLNHCKHT